MLAFLALCLPIFAVVAFGFAAAKQKWMPATAIEAVGIFSFNVALPAMLFKLMAAQPLRESFDAIYFAGYLGACMAIFASVMLIGRLTRGNIRIGAAFGAIVKSLTDEIIMPVIGAIVGSQPFGGEGLSGTGHKAGGPNYLHRFCAERVTSTDTTSSGGNASLLSLDDIGL